MGFSEDSSQAAAQVWSVILSSWSEYFAQMMIHDFEEKNKREVVTGLFLVVLSDCVLDV